MLKEFISRYHTPLLLFVLSFLMFGQAGFMQQPLRWDAIDCFLPWRLNVAEAIRGGELPLWSVFQHLGFPLHADADTGAFYPILWGIALVYGYDYYAINFEWCLHVFIGAWGMWKLIKKLGYSELSAWVCALGFMGSGIYTSNAQNFGFLIGMSWFPWVFLTLRDALNAPTNKHILYFAITCFFILTGSYPPIVVIAAYVLMAYVIYFFIKNYRSKSIYRTFVRLGVWTLIICALPIMSAFENFHDVTRTTGLDARKILENPFPLKGYASVIAPFAVGTQENYNWGSDFSMINLYFGMGALIGVFGWFFAKQKQLREYLALATFVVLMLIAAGDSLPFRMWLAKFPAMDMFRHPSIFRFIALPFLLIVAAAGLDQIFSSKRILYWSLGSIFLLCAAIFGFNYSATFFQDLGHSLSELMSWKREVPISVGSRLAVHAFIQLVFIIGFALVALKKNTFILLSFLNLLLAVQLNIQSTVVFPNILARENHILEQIISSRTPYQGESVENYCQDSTNTGMSLVWRNENIYLRQPGWDGYNSYIFGVYREIEDSGELLRFSKKPLMFLSDSTISLLTAQWHIGTNSIEADVNIDRPAELVLLQSFQKSWVCELDQERIAVESYQGTFPKVHVSEGLHHIRFEYRPIKTIVAIWVSIIGMLILLILNMKKEEKALDNSLK